jgi:hypothetical protein
VWLVVREALRHRRSRLRAAEPANPSKTKKKRIGEIRLIKISRKTNAEMETEGILPEMETEGILPEPETRKRRAAAELRRRRVI